MLECNACSAVDTGWLVVVSFAGWQLSEKAGE
jgi:hypothetical protein